MHQPCAWRDCPLPANDLAALRDSLEVVMRAAGEVALETARKPFRRWTKGHDHSPVTEADIAVNDLLHDGLCTLVPDADWLSEESHGSLNGESARLAWIVDPIDGTRSYISGLADWTISV